MAQVFWIIVGTGSVNLVTFSSFNATSQPASTALGTTQQYGRKLLQSTASFPMPAENVTFAVTLPTASQNSLLVLQSNSDKVTQQFSGWFVTQMASRGMSIVLAHILFVSAIRSTDQLEGINLQHDLSSNMHQKTYSTRNYHIFSLATLHMACNRVFRKDPVLYSSFLHTQSADPSSFLVRVKTSRIKLGNSVWRKR